MFGAGSDYQIEKCISKADFVILGNRADGQLTAIEMDAGCIVGPCTCGPCLGGHMGILGTREAAVTTTNRNFKGRMGTLDSQLYLASPIVAAASAVAGKVAGPNEIGLN